MRYLYTAIFLFGTLWGATAMSSGLDFNRETRETLKKSINYPALIASRPLEKTIVLDWQQALLKLKDEQGNVWVGKADEPALGAEGEGQLRINLQSQKGAAIVNIVALAGNWQERLDYVVIKKSLTDRADFNLTVLPGIEDLYLIPKVGSDISFTTFLYGNLYIDVQQWDAGDIDALAKAIYQLVKNNSQVIIAEPQAGFRVTADKRQLKVGDTVSVKVEGLVQNWSSQWIYNQPQLLLVDAVEYIEQNDNVFIFKALKPGKMQIPFTAMNTQTLYVEKQSVTLEIN